MIKRSLKASENGRLQAKKAFQRKGWTQEYLAGEVGLETRQSIWKFFAGRPIERHIFIDICHILDLPWEDIADFATETNSDDPVTDGHITSEPDYIGKILGEARQHLSRQVISQCSTINLSENRRPVPLEKIYITQKIHPFVQSETWLNVSDLNREICEYQPPELISFEKKQVFLQSSFLLPATSPAMNIIESYEKLIIFGKPGSGKTTLLRYISLLAIQQKLHHDYIPCLISIRHFMQVLQQMLEPTLLSYISYKYMQLGIKATDLEVLLKQGKVLLLLDGLDEVNIEQQLEFTQKINNFIDIYYENQVIITCRSGGMFQNYLANFTSVELADFTPEDVKAFAEKWFVLATDNLPEVGLAKAHQFMEKLATPENQFLRELAITPIILNLLVAVFENQNDFPTKRKKLYEVALNIFFFRLDKSFVIEKDSLCLRLSFTEKIDLFSKILSKIAFSTFKSGHYFFEEEQLINYISEYLPDCLQADLEASVLQRESKNILKLLTMQHGLLVEQAKGIYSFSHIAFQKYFKEKYLENIDKGESENPT